MKIKTKCKIGMATGIILSLITFLLTIVPSLVLMFSVLRGSAADESWANLFEFKNKTKVITEVFGIGGAIIFIPSLVVFKRILKKEKQIANKSSEPIL